MYLLLRSIPILTPLLILLGLEIILAKPSLVWWIIPFLFALSILAILLLTASLEISVISRLFFKKKNLSLFKLPSQKPLFLTRWQFFLAPFLFLLSSLLFFIVLTPKNEILKHLLIIFIAGFLAIILESLFNFFHRQTKYPLFAIENIYSYLDLIIFFFFSASFYYLIIFSNFPFWLLLIFIIIISSLLSYQVFWANKILDNPKTTYLFILTIGLILGELFWIISFWPTGFYFNALFLSLFYYIIIGLSRYHLLGQLDKKIVKRYLMIGGICLVIALLTTRWG